MLVDYARPLLGLVAACLLSACAAGSGGGASSGGDPNRITAEQLAALQVSSAYEAVQQLRPRWLSSRDAREPVRVVVNGALRGEVAELRQIQPSTIREMRYLDGRDATTRFGVGYGAGVIVVTTR